MKVLGISCYYHDSAAVLIENGKVLFASLLERYTRKKHDAEFPELSIKAALTHTGIKTSDIDYVVFYEKPFLKFERILQSALTYAPRTPISMRDGLFTTFSKKIWIREKIANTLNVDRNRILFVPHHLSHAASAFLPSPYPTAAILTVDGVGEWSTASLGYGNNHEIKILSEMRFPESVGLLYSTFTAFLGFQVNEGEYKVMGMAGYGEPIYKDKIGKVVRINNDGSIHLDLSYFSYHYHHNRSFSRKFRQLFGIPRTPYKPFDISSSDDKRYADIAASIQEVTEEIVLAMARYVRKTTGMKYLCLAGGVALNGRANYRLAKEKVFEDIFIQPAAGDAGGAMGAALYVDWYFGKKLRKPLTTVFLGSEYSGKEIDKAIRKAKLKSIKPGSDERFYSYLAQQLVDGKIIGWYQGRFEWGPRALGARSILADPRNPKMKLLVNEKIKFREPFRPFAPSVLTDQLDKYFDISEKIGKQTDRSNPFNLMLYVTKVRNKYRKVIPAVTHIDGTSRPQTVRKDIAPEYYELINSFYKLTGIPMLLNTSFNLSTEPMVATPEDAIKTFKASGLDILVVGKKIIEKT